MDTNYSVLMSVYAKEKPCFLKESIASMLAQTVKTDDFVIVCDGPLTPELDLVLQQYTQDNPDVFHIVRLAENVGIGAAAEIGLQACKNDLVAKMDADDISVPNRCQLQLARFAENLSLTIIGSNIDEFDADPNLPHAVRWVPADYESILKFGRRRQPFNNMTVMYKKSAVLAAGGYRPLRRNEDYDLYVRLLAKGYYAENIPLSLVKVRVNTDAVHRRVSFGTVKGCVISRWNAYKIGYASLGDFLYCVIGQFIVFICPRKVQKWIYARFLRKGNAESDNKGEVIRE